MPITYKVGNIFESMADILINPINTKGVMGKGLALQFKNGYPEMFKQYKNLCSQNKLKPGGKLFIYERNNKFVVNYPTKIDYRNPSSVKIIGSSIDQLKNFLKKHPQKTVAIPPLGCGLGGLTYDKVYPIIHKLNNLPNKIISYVPINYKEMHHSYYVNNSILEFRGKYNFLSNFFESKITYNEIIYHCSEVAYQAHKSENIKIHERFSEITDPAQSKIVGKTIKLRKNFERIKTRIMLDICREKFKNPELRAKLLLTGKRLLVEGNKWRDRFWGMDKNKIPMLGLNRLGHILMKIRSDLCPDLYLKKYTGVGSRDTPQKIQKLEKAIAVEMRKRGWILRSGGAKGSDLAFEKGAGYHKEIFMPDKTTPVWAQKRIIDYIDSGRNFHSFKPATKELLSRDMCQVMGLFGDDNSDNLLCWTEGGAALGGTRYAIRCAEDHRNNVPVSNLGEEKTKNRFVNWLKNM